MMNKSASRLGGLYLLIFGCFYLFTLSNLTYLSQSDVLFCIGTSAFIELVGILILYARKKANPQTGAFRILIMITVQLLSFMSVSLALIYTNQSNTVVLHLLGLGLTLMLVQTVYIVSRLKSADEF